MARVCRPIEPRILCSRLHHPHRWLCRQGQRLKLLVAVDREMHEHRVRPLLAAGFSPEQAEEISALHALNFM